MSFPGRIRFDERMLQSAGEALLVLIVLACLISSKALIAIAFLLVFTIAIPFSSLLALLFFALVLGLVVPMSEWPIQMPGFRLYGADGLLFFLISASVTMAWRAGWGKPCITERPPSERVLPGLAWALALWGCVAVVNGAAVGHYPINDVLGDFRRLHVYVLAFLIPTLCVSRPQHFRLVPAAIVVAGVALLLTAGYRVISGNSYNELYFTAAAYEPRWMAASETAALELFIAYCSVKFMMPGFLPARIGYAFLTGLSISMLLISGWRLAAILGVVVPIVSFAMLARMRGTTRGFRLKLVLAGGFLLALVLLIMALAIPELTREHLERLMRRFAELGEPDGRYFAWNAALTEFANAPILGKGMGHQLFHYFRSSDGAWLGRVMTTHNYPLDVLYQSGIIGFALFCALHGYYNMQIWRRYRETPECFTAPLVALYVGYLCNFVTHFLEPSLPAAIVGLYMCMGFSTAMLSVPMRPAGQEIGAGENPDQNS